MTVVVVWPPTHPAGCFDSWRTWRKAASIPTPAAPEIIWRPCPTCWGQGRIWESDGTQWHGHLCGTCLGFREVQA